MEYYGNTQKKSFIYIDIKTAQNVLRARSNKQKQCYVWRHLGTLLSEPPGKSTIYICVYIYILYTHTYTGKTESKKAAT